MLYYLFDADHKSSELRSGPRKHKVEASQLAHTPTLSSLLPLRLRHPSSSHMTATSRSAAALAAVLCFAFLGAVCAAHDAHAPAAARRLLQDAPTASVGRRSLTVTKPVLKAPMVSALEASEYDEPLSKFAFNLNLRRYTSGTASSSSTDFSFERRGRGLLAANDNSDMVRPRAYGTWCAKNKQDSCRWRVHLNGCVDPMTYHTSTDIFGDATVCSLLNDNRAHRAHRPAHRAHRRPRGRAVQLDNFKTRVESACSLRN